MAKYEFLNENEFKNLILDIISSNEEVTKELAVNRYNELIKNVDSNDCIIDNNTTSIRKGIWEQLIKLKYVPF